MPGTWSAGTIPTNPAADDIYLHDRRTGTTERISVALDGGSAFAAGATMSADARYIAFNAKADRMETDPGDLFGVVYVLDRRTGVVERITNRNRPDNPALLQGLSADGRYVAYTQLVPRSSYGRTWVHDRRTGTEEQVNVKPDGTPAQRYAMPASLSADGRTIAFDYWGDEELVPGETPSAASTVYVRDLRKDVTRRVNAGPADENRVREPRLNPDGRYVAYQADPRLADGRLGPPTSTSATCAPARPVWSASPSPASRSRTSPWRCTRSARGPGASAWAANRPSSSSTTPTATTTASSVASAELARPTWHSHGTTGGLPCISHAAPL